MENDRDSMYYGSYGYGFIPQMQNTMPGNMMPNNMMSSNMAPNNMFSTGSTYQTSQINDINERLNRLERQIKRIDQRLTRLETPYANTNYNEPDNNMYMM